MNIVYTNDEDFERKISRMTIAELERAKQTLNIYLVNYKASSANYSPENAEKYSKPYIARYELRISQVEALLRARS